MRVGFFIIESGEKLLIVTLCCLVIGFTGCGSRTGMQDIEGLIKDLHKTFDNLSGEPDESLEGSNYIIDPIDMIRIEW